MVDPSSPPLLLHSSFSRGLEDEGVELSLITNVGFPPETSCFFALSCNSTALLSGGAEPSCFSPLEAVVSERRVSSPEGGMVRGWDLLETVGVCCSVRLVDI